jgi:hypothetical protein
MAAVAELFGKFRADDSRVRITAALGVHIELGIGHVPGYTPERLSNELLVRHFRVVDADLVAARYRRRATCNFVI